MRSSLALLALLAPALLAGCAGEVPEDAVVVDLTIRRYEFEPGTAQPIEVPVGSVVVFRLRTEDVAHGFAIEGLHPGVTVPPGEVVEVRVRVDRAGEFRIYCTVFCGAGHPQHLGTLAVV